MASAWNLPNAVTIARLVCVPIIGYLILGPDTPTARWIAAAVFVVAASTDFVDGALARAWGQVTALGTLLDPIVDKALIGTALITLSITGQIAWWITIVIMVREVGITVLRLAVVRRHVIPASPAGRVKTVVQIVGITMALVPLESLPGWEVITQVVLGLAVVVTVATGLDYVVKVARLLRATPGASR